jgi:hypothetical protein
MLGAVMAIDFPDTPLPGTSFTAAGVTWVWSGVVWKKLVASSGGATDNVTVTTASTTPNQTLDAALAGAVKFVVRADDGTNTDVTEVLAVTNGTDVIHTEYGRIGLGSDLAEYNVTAASGVISLKATPASATSTTYVISKQVLSSVVPDGDDPVTALFSDDFNRADASTLGAPWVTLGNEVWGVSNNKAKLLADCTGGGCHDSGQIENDWIAFNFALVDIEETDFDLSVTISDAGGNGNVDAVIVFRSDANATEWLSVNVYEAGGGDMYIYGTPYFGTFDAPDLGEISASPSGTVYVVRIVASGSTLTVYLDGVERYSGTPSGFAAMTGTHVGIATWQGYIDNVNTTFDDFVVTPVVSSP